jgi:hypothetical protein
VPLKSRFHKIPRATQWQATKHPAEISMVFAGKKVGGIIGLFGREPQPQDQRYGNDSACTGEPKHGKPQQTLRKVTSFRFRGHQ